MRSSASPPSSALAASTALPSGSKPSPTPTKLRHFVNFSRAPSVSDFRPEASTDWRARSRNSSLVIGWRAAPMMRKPSGIRPTWERWNIPGSSLRLARSPVAPKRTITWLVLTRSAAGSATALAVVTLTERRLQASSAGPIVEPMPSVSEEDKAALDRIEKRFYRDQWEAIPGLLAADHGMRL